METFLPVSSSRLKSGALSLTSITQYFYRRRRFQVILLAGFAITLSVAQKKPSRSGPRATGILMMAPDGKAVRLIPVCIRDNGQFWDASIYQADPRPMAVEPGTVYEAERTGRSIGLFTVSQAAQQNGSWIGLGTLQSKFSGPRSTSASSSSQTTSEEDRPILRRAPAPPGELPAETSAKSQPTAPAEESDRPVLKRGMPEAESRAAAPPSAPSPGNSGQKPVGKASEAAAKPPEWVPAVSDADGPDPRSFTIERNADAEASLRKTSLGFAEQSVLKHAASGPGSRVEFRDVAARYFDLDGNNSAEVVLTARAAMLPPKPGRARPASSPPSPQREFFLTFIAREDIYGELHAAYSQIVDVRQADLDGRLELIDAVDVDGDDRGELLFRRITGGETSYLVLKVGLSQTTKLFDSAGQ